MRIGQSHRHSALEAVIGTSIGFGIAWGTNLLVLPYFGFDVSSEDSFWIAVIFTFVSFLRSYFVRRLFNYLHLMDIL